MPCAAIALEDRPPLAVDRDDTRWGQDDKWQRGEQQSEGDHDPHESLGARSQEAKHAGAQRIDLRERANEDRRGARAIVLALECDECQDDQTGHERVALRILQRAEHIEKHDDKRNPRGASW